MALHCSVGDQVEMPWENRAYSADVFAVHASGKVGAVYAVNDSVGMLLSAAEAAAASKPGALPPCHVRCLRAFPLCAPACIASVRACVRP